MNVLNSLFYIEKVLAGGKAFTTLIGRMDKRYLSYPFMGIPKKPGDESLFIEYFEHYYDKVDNYAKSHPERFLEVNISEFGALSFINPETKNLDQLIFNPKSSDDLKVRFEFYLQHKSIHSKYFMSLYQENFNKILIFEDFLTILDHK